MNSTLIEFYVDGKFAGRLFGCEFVPRIGDHIGSTIVRPAPGPVVVLPRVVKVLWESCSVTVFCETQP